MELREHAEALASTLGEDTEEVLAELEGLLQYHVPLEEAKQSIMRARGGGGASGGPAVERPIGGVTVEDDRVSVVGRVQTLGRRRIRVREVEAVSPEPLDADAGAYPHVVIRVGLQGWDLALNTLRRCRPRG